MAIKLQFAGILCAFFFSLNPVTASNEPPPYENNPILPETCTAPPPDSFQVTSRGPGFISVAWNPVWPNVQHTMYILTRTDTSDWIPLDTVYNLPGSAYTYENMAFEANCRLEIATNCASGEPGMERNILQDKIIIELTTGGRVPVTPDPISCNDIPWATSEWVGYEVKQLVTGFPAKNTFEVKVIEGYPTFIKIMRVYENAVVFAANDDGFIPPPVIDWKTNPFKMLKRVPNQFDHIIGKLEVTKNGPSISVCKFNPPPWDISYSFTPMKANSAIGLAPPPVAGDVERTEKIKTLHSVGKISAQSPFYETLYLFMESKIQTSGKAIIRLISTTGKTVLERQVQTPFEQILLTVDTISSGVYLLRVETDEEIQTLKVVKGR